MSKLQRLIEKVFVVISIIAFTDGILPIVSEIRGILPNENDLIKQVILFGIWVGIVFLIVAWHKKVIRVAVKEKLLWVVVWVALLSILWSAAPIDTLRSALVLLMSTLFGVYLAARYSLNEQLRLLAWALGISALLSLILAVLLPSYGVMGMGSMQAQRSFAHVGAWRGIYAHKNILGLIMSLGTLVFLLVAKSSRKHRWVAWAGFCLCVSLLLVSTAKTALIIFLIMMALIPLYQTLRWNYTFALPSFIVILLLGGSAAALLLDNSETFLGNFGRDTTLTGRTLLWAILLDKIWQRPWQGYGYGGFWHGWEGESADVWRIVQWEVPHAHNGFLDLWLSLGLLGLIVFVLSFISTCLRAITLVRQTKTAEYLLPLAYLSFLLIANITESPIIRPSIFWVLYVSLCFVTKKNLDNKEKQKAEISQINDSIQTIQ